MRIATVCTIACIESKNNEETVPCRGKSTQGETLWVSAGQRHRMEKPRPFILVSAIEALENYTCAVEDFLGLLDRSNGESDETIQTRHS